VKRGGSLKRKKALHPLYAWIHPRKPLKARGSRSAREAEALKAMREVVLARAGSVCERCGCKSLEPLEVHHVVRRARCPGWPLRNSATLNGLGVDRWCHSALTIDPMDRGGPCEGVARLAHEAFEAWRAASGNPRKEFT